MFKFILKKAVPVPDPEAFESYLFVGPHPDDIEVACAPTVAKLAAAGKKITFLIVADDSQLCDERPTLRQKEAVASAALLGVRDVRFVMRPDGGMYPVEPLAADIAKLIAEIKPDMVFTADPTVASECHPDHIKTGLAVKHAVTIAPFGFLMKPLGCEQTHQVKALGFFYTARPNSYIAVKKYVKMRRRAMECHVSQFSQKDIDDIELYFKLRNARLGLRRLRGACEGFWVLSPTHTHCFPEASE